jgi:anhydro-N-acetylmuramic acid kinase
LARLWAKEKRIGLGLMSGTSMDGVDAALVEVAGRPGSTRARLLLFETYPFPPLMRKRMLRLPSAQAGEICEMNFLTGEFFAKSAMKLLRRAGFSPRQIDFIGSHGQTIYHISGERGKKNSTLQIGEGAVIAARTGVITVCDFRPGDIAAGGTGAPLVPFADFILFREKGKTRAFVNIGGIANVTLLREKWEDVLAFDTGPGNMVIDGLMRIKTRGEKQYDEKGRLAARGKIRGELLKKWLGHPYFSRKPPKSTGRETFGEEFVKKIWSENRKLPFHDLLATATFLTAASIYRSFQNFIAPRWAVDEVFISGGGSHNLTLMAFLENLFYPVPIEPLNVLGIEGDAKEAMAFALLADAAIQGMAANVPSATGADRPARLGKIIL